jgi:hypothetical protein
MIIGREPAIFTRDFLFSFLKTVGYKKVTVLRGVVDSLISELQ